MIIKFEHIFLDTTKFATFGQFLTDTHHGEHTYRIQFYSVDREGEGPIYIFEGDLDKTNRAMELIKIGLRDGHRLLDLTDM